MTLIPAPQRDDIGTDLAGSRGADGPGADRSRRRTLGLRVKGGESQMGPDSARVRIGRARWTRLSTTTPEDCLRCKAIFNVNRRMSWAHNAHIGGEVIVERGKDKCVPANPRSMTNNLDHHSTGMANVGLGVVAIGRDTSKQWDVIWVEER